MLIGPEKPHTPPPPRPETPDDPERPPQPPRPENPPLPPPGQPDRPPITPEHPRIPEGEPPREPTQPPIVAQYLRKDSRDEEVVGTGADAPSTPRPGDDTSTPLAEEGYDIDLPEQPDYGDESQQWEVEETERGARSTVTPARPKDWE